MFGMKTLAGNQSRTLTTIGVGCNGKMSLGILLHFIMAYVRRSVRKSTWQSNESGSFGR